MTQLFKCLLLSLPLVACGGNNANAPQPEPNVQQPLADVDYSKLTQTKLEPGTLRQASTNELTSMLKNGLRVSLKDYKNFSMLMRETSLTVTADSSANSGNFSGTNLQVSGVDEADSLKYDGTHIYLATPSTYSEAGAVSSLKIFATDAQTNSATEVSSTPLDSSHWGDVSGIYLVGEKHNTRSLVTLRRSWNFIAFNTQFINGADSTTKIPEALVASTQLAENSRMASIWPYQMNQGIEINLYDVRSAAAPNKTWSVTIDGDLLGSRKIGNKLYIVSSFIPSIPNLDYASDTVQLRRANENLIAQTSLEKLLPQYAINGASPQPLITHGCLIPAKADINSGQLSLVNITSFDLDTQQLLNSVCVNSNVDGIYVSANNVYLGGSAYQPWENWESFTQLHKFSLDTSGVNYAASGSVAGVLGWNQPAYRMDEQNNILRVITTQYDKEGLPKHTLSVLEKATGRSELTLIAELPNKDRPEAIGKPREDIYSVRFNGNKAYVVTFERKDPLYVLDLSTVTDPKIAGSLEVPGYSTYLHPIGENFLFSLGNETDKDGRQTALKVSLFDIRNPQQPQLLNSYLFGNANSWSDALYDPHALSFLQTSDDQLRISLPATLFEDAQQPGEDFITNRWLDTSLHLFEVNGLANQKPSLENVGKIIGEDNTTVEYPSWNGVDRSILHADSIFYIHNNQVIASPWLQP
jgi:uncharacterized secreted protein with C-terminal beta-propeller domain